MSAWNQLKFEEWKTLDQYNQKFWDACFPVASYRYVTLPEQIEKYCCGLPVELKHYCIKKPAYNVQQVMAHARDGYALLTRKMTFGTSKQPAEKEFQSQKNKNQSGLFKRTFRGNGCL